MNNEIFHAAFIDGLFRFKALGFSELGLSEFNEQNLIILLNDRSFSETKPDYKNYEEGILPAKKFLIGNSLQINVYTHELFISQFVEIFDPNTAVCKPIYISPKVLGFYQGYEHKKLKFFIGNSPLYDYVNFRNVKKV